MAISEKSRTRDQRATPRRDSGLRTEMQQLHNRLLVQLTAITIGAVGIGVTVTVALLR